MLPLTHSLLMVQVMGNPQTYPTWKGVFHFSLNVHWFVFMVFIDFQLANGHLVVENIEVSHGKCSHQFELPNLPIILEIQ